MYHYAANNPVRYTDPDGREVVGQAKRSLLHRLAVNSKTTEWAKHGKFPNEMVGFSFDTKNNTYHATFDCWQGSLFKGYIGYNKLYDMLFNLGTSMDAVAFEFSSGGQDYALWGWKGDYLNMGAGCELGIYTKADGLLGELGHYVVDKSLAMKSTASLFLGGLDGVQIGTFNSESCGNDDGKHWWGTIFNPFQQNRNKDELTAQFNITFPTRQLYEDFKAQRMKDSRLSNWNDNNNSVTVIF